MKIKLLTKLFYRNNFLLIFSIAFFIASIGSIIFGIISCFRMDSEPLDYLLQTLRVSAFVYVFFLFISYEYLYKIKQHNAEEILKCINNGYQSYFSNSFYILLILSILYTTVLLAINIIVYIMLGINNTDYFWHIFKNIFLNIFLVSIIAILLRILLSFIKIRLMSYVLMISIIFISSSLFELIVSGVYAGINVNIYPIYDFFNIFPPLLKWAPIHTFGYSLLPYRVDLILFWIFLLLSILILLIFEKRRNHILILSIICFCVSLLCLIGYFQPSSKVTMSDDPVSGALADAYYYSENLYVEENASKQFDVKKYTLDLKIDRELQVTATLELEKNDCTCYDFTLYHGYVLESVFDINGNELVFTQDGDYISIKANNDPLTKLMMNYSGSSIKCFSNVQGTCLPGWFAYYPHPGHLSLFNSDQEFFERILCVSNTEFLITVNTYQQVYCNLDKIGENVFWGFSDGVTIVSGFYDNFSYNDIEVIYPSLSINEFSHRKIKEFLDEVIGSEILTENQKQIFVIPNTNMSSVYERFCAFSDHITLRQLMGLPMIYNMQKIPSFKLTLYNAYNTYKTNPEYFSFVVSDRNEMIVNSNTDIYILLNKALQELGEKYVEQQIVIYLNNDADKRKGYIFLNDLMR